MTFRRRFKLSEQQRNDMWRRWKAGQSLHEIGRACGKAHGVIQFMLAQHGGIAPATRHRSLRTLTVAAREEISRGIASGGAGGTPFRSFFVDMASRLNNTTPARPC